MKFAFRLILFLTLNACFVACSLMPDELKTAEKLMETAPDSALHILQQLSPDKYASGENRALYGLLLMEALDKKMLPFPKDSLLDFSIAYYQEHPASNRLANCYLYKGRMYKSVFRYEEAMDCYLKAQDAIYKPDDYMLQGRINFDLGDIYNIQADYMQARKKYKITYGYFSKANFQPQAFYALLYIGRTYFSEKNYRKAESTYRKIYTLAKDSVQRGVLMQEMGFTFYKSGKLDSALTYYKTAIKYPYIGNNQAIRHSLLAQLYFDLEKMDSAFYYASAAFKYNPPVRIQRECYRVMANCEFARGRIADVTLYMNKYVALGDSIRKIDSQTKGSYMETMHETKKEAIKNEYQVWYLSGFALLVVVGFSAFIVFMVRRTKKEKEQIQETHTEEKAGIRKKVVVDKRAVLQQKIEEIKAGQLSERKAINLQEREEQIRKMYEDLLHITDQAFFFSEMDIVFNGLVTKLQRRYSGIKPKELIWCCLCLLKIPSHDMLILLDYKTHNSLKMLKSRLSDKFELDNASLLGAFLINLLSED